MTKYIVNCDCGQEIKIPNRLLKAYEDENRIPITCRSCGSLIICEKENSNQPVYKQRQSTTKIWQSILQIFEENQPPLTVRQIYYALTVRDVVEKTEAGYRKAAYHLAKMRRRGIFPYGHIADNTRWHIKPDSYKGLDAALNNWQAAYRRDLWANQDDYVEIWVEKDALAGVISPITLEFDVPLYVARGYGSMTFIYEAAETIKQIGKPAYIYHFGDFDPSGVDAALNIRDGLRSHGAKIFFERTAITEEQIGQLGLPTRKTKKSDPRSHKWGEKPSVELDALPAMILRDLVRQCIERHINPEILQRTRQIEALERETLEKVQNNLVQVPNSDSETS